MKNTILFLLVVIGLGGISSCESTSTKPSTTTSEITQPAPKKVAPPKVIPASKFCYGIDISDIQGNEIDFINKNKDSLSFIICKATEGITYTDPDFNKNWKMISEKGFIKGAYHFYRSKDDPEDQAKNYLRAIANLDKTDLPPIVDFESSGIDQSQSIELIQSNLLFFLGYIQKASRRKPMIYTNNYVGDKYLNNDKFSNYTLWIADYDQKTTPVLPHIWRDQPWQFWQKSDSYTIDNKKNDFDIFNGNQNQLSTFIKNY